MYSLTICSNDVIVGHLKNGGIYPEVICIEVDALCDSFITGSEELIVLQWLYLQRLKTKHTHFRRRDQAKDSFIVLVNVVSCTCQTAVRCSTYR